MTRRAIPSPSGDVSDASMPETVRNEATDIAASAAEQAGQVADVIGEQAKAVVSETGRQARQLLEQGVSEMRGQAREEQQKVAGGLRNLAGQLRTVSERSESGMAADVVRQVSERASSAASWLESGYAQPRSSRPSRLLTKPDPLSPTRPDPARGRWRRGSERQGQSHRVNPSWR